MTLIKSISGIRGTIGGKPHEGLSPLEIVRIVSAYASFIQSRSQRTDATVVVGCDARTSRFMLKQLVSGTLMAMGIHVIDLDLSTTPTVEMAVTGLNAQGGIILTASHNPIQWNALKLLNEQGEFLSETDGSELLSLSDSENFTYADVSRLGTYSTASYLEKHIEKILELPLVDAGAIRNAKLSVVVDAVNSVGGIAIPALLKALGVHQIHELYCTPNGNFPHNPEPLPENLQELANEVVKKKAHCGFSVDPDVDRLAIVREDGEMFGEEYTLVAVADYVLQNTKGDTVSNLSSTRALSDITQKHGQQYHPAAVGEVNVVEKMKETHAIIGGEGNGGVIYPELHYGRDALVGIALFLTHLAKSKKSCSTLREEYPSYYISKNKITLEKGMNVDEILQKIESKYRSHPINTVDGVRIDFNNEWVHLRKSNTEPIIRIYSESNSLAKADVLARKIVDDISQIIKGHEVSVQ